MRRIRASGPWFYLVLLGAFAAVALALAAVQGGNDEAQKKLPEMMLDLRT